MTCSESEHPAPNPVKFINCTKDLSGEIAPVPDHRAPMLTKTKIPKALTVKIIKALQSGVAPCGFPGLALRTPGSPAKWAQDSLSVA